MNDLHESLAAILDEHVAVAVAARSTLIPDLATLATHVIDTIENGGTVVSFGNGGSAADAQHLAAELVGHFRRERRALPAVALSTDTSVLTAIANDYGYDEVFARQVEAHCGPGDLVIGISTSGKAQSVVRGVQAARRLGARTWALTGADGGPLATAAEHALRVPSEATARIQELHIVVIHAVSELVDAHVAARDEVGA